MINRAKGNPCPGPYRSSSRSDTITGGGNTATLRFLSRHFLYIPFAFWHFRSFFVRRALRESTQRFAVMSQGTIITRQEETRDRLKERTNLDWRRNFIRVRLSESERAGLRTLRMFGIVSSYEGWRHIVVSRRDACSQAQEKLEPQSRRVTGDGVRKLHGDQ